jgi:type IV pilus assembly protein PilX
MNSNVRNVPTFAASQRGATLIVGLVLLLVLTVVGVSGMNTATMEINMAANTQFQQDAIQMTETGIDAMLATRDYTTDSARTLELTGNADYDRRAVTTYRMNTDVPDAAFSSDEVEAFHFEVRSVGRGSRNAQSEHAQSFYVVGRAL